MKFDFQPEHFFLIFIIALVVLNWKSLKVKNSGILTQSDSQVSNSKPIGIYQNRSTTNENSRAVVGADGNLLSEVPAGVGTRTIEERIKASKSGFGWDSSSLLPKTNSGLDTMSPIEFSKNQNFLEPQKLIGSMLDSNRNPNQQLRRDPVIPPKDVGPFLQSTISPDYERKPLDC